MDRGFVSPYMVTDATRMEAVYDRPLILITDKKLSSVAEVMPLLGQLAQAKGKSLVIIADEIDGEALSALVFNKVKGVLDVVAVKAPAFGDRRREVLEDIAVLAGTRVVKDGLEDLSLDELGGARRVTVTKGSTTIIEGAGTEEDVNPRLKQLDAQIEGTSSEYDGENLRKRRADLSGKVAVLKIGGATETEIEEKKYRVDDAVAAVKAALKEGVLPGGGVALVEIAETVDNDIVANALRQPFKHLMDNAGLVPEVMLADVQQAKAGMGVDVTSGKLLDMKAAGILDPTRVAKEAVRSAISIAATIITMGALAVEVPEASDD
jgi:chaperonin GroEL